MSTEPKMTPWFANGEKPARVGVYQQRSGSGSMIGYQLWGGALWYSWCESVEEAACQLTPVAESYQNDPWRGLASKP